MQNIFDKFLELMASFEKNDVEYVLIGGIAIILHGFTRNTQDIDLFVNPKDENIIKLRKSLLEVFDDEEINEITYSELEKYPVIRYVAESGFVIDIITGIGEKFKFEDLNSEMKIIDGIKIKLADIKTLYKLKEQTYREIDQLDLKFLKSKLGK